MATYASLTDLQRRQPVFSGGTYSDLALVQALEAQARMLDMRLQRSFSLPVSVPASGTLTFAGNPADGATVTIGSKVYRFKDTPALVNDVLRGATATASAAALNQTIIQGITGYYYTGTTVNTDAASSRDSLVLTLTSRKAGASGNDLALSSSSAAIVAVSFSGGLREYDVLVQLNAWMAADSLLIGQATSPVSGASGSPLVSDLQRLIRSAWEQIEQAPYLYDTDGTALAAKSGAMHTDCESSYPIADSGDPVGWGHDPDREVTRE